MTRKTAASKTLAIALMPFIMSMNVMAQAPDEIEHYLFEAYPDHIQARLEQQQREALSLPRTDEDELLAALGIEILKRWNPGQTITVAFKSGTSDLHKKIADAALEWTKYANLKFDFGLDLSTGQYRTWSSSDQDYKADVRISFDDIGYWSVIGTNSRNAKVVPPGKASMNLEGFDRGLPNNWASTVVHEFGHVIAAKHEHQHPVQGCDNEWRWDDDAGYVATTDREGRFLKDANGRRPGVYTVLSGYPNNWPESKVDRNLRQLENTTAYDFGEFDRHSIMKYYFADWMFKNGRRSQCYTGSKNLVLSDEDRLRIAEVYPADEKLVSQITERKRGLLSNLLAKSQAAPALREMLQMELQMFQ